ncbi:MAG TPA: cyclic nucleotide-binding domain-containing protein [bacterium]|nr:cyclic nucleotide-binding domain-containing protein [bacterium]HOL48495.1 cyclic nucleotide-binding domain-containing protein [bacterium]HPQ17656.1 cyclic nucleotide-binding domain-containing protein [bacterium]
MYEENFECNEDLAICLRPLFIGMPDEWIEEILAISEKVTFKKNEYILKEGEQNNNIYIIIKGHADVLIKRYEDEKTNRIIAIDSSPTMYNLYIGDFIGEISIIDLEPASASVLVTSEEMECIKLPIEKLCEILKKNKDMHIMFLINLAKIIARRLRYTNKLLSKYFYLENYIKEKEVKD